MSNSAHSATGLRPSDAQMQPINQSAAPVANYTNLEDPHLCNREIINCVQIVNCPFYTKENQEPLWLKSMSPDSKEKKTNRFMTAQLKKTMSVPCEIEKKTLFVEEELYMWKINIIPWRIDVICECPCQPYQPTSSRTSPVQCNTEAQC